MIGKIYYQDKNGDRQKIGEELFSHNEKRDDAIQVLLENHWDKELSKQYSPVVEIIDDNLPV